MSGDGIGGVRFERYMDETVVQSASEKQPLMLRDKIGSWLSHLGLRLHPRRVVAHPSRTSSGLAAALVVGALPALAFPAPSWWWLAWFGIVPLLLVVRAAPTARAAALRACCGMAGYILATQYWLLPSAGPLLIVLAIGLGALWLPWGLAAYLLLGDPITARGTLAAMVVLPSAWVMAEAVRSLPSLGGPWAPLGASQWNQPATLASASLGGVWLTSFVIVGANTAIAGVILHRRASARVIAATVALACAGLGPAWFWLAPAPPPGPTVRVALVQPGNLQDSVARQAAGEALTTALAGQRLDLVVWGESSVGVDLAGQPEAMTRLAELSRRVGADLLVNVDARDRTGGIYKSSVLIGPNGSRGAYSKTRLVPFGEYVPLRPLLVGPPGTPRRPPRTDGAAVDRSCCTPDGRREATRECSSEGSPSDRSSVSRQPSPTSPAKRCSAARSCWFIRVPPRRSKELGRSRSWPARPRYTRRRWATRRCTLVCRAPALPSTHGAGNSPGTPPPNAARSW